MTYVIDSDVLIDAKNRYYGFDTCPGFWDWLEVAHADGDIRSVEKVKEELLGGQDGLSQWTRDHGHFFVAPDQQVVASLRELTAWSMSGDYTRAAINEFLAAGDSYLVAHAHAHDLVVVTQEVPAVTTKKIKIPNACGGIGVRHCNLFTMLRESGVRFVLAPHPA